MMSIAVGFSALAVLHLHELALGGGLLGVQAGLYAVKQPLEPAEKLGLCEPDL